MSKWKKIGVVAAIAVTCGLLGAGVSTAANLSGKLSTTTSSESSSDSSDSTTTANDLTKTNSDSGSVTNASKEIGSTSDANSSDSTDSAKHAIPSIISGRRDARMPRKKIGNAACEPKFTTGTAILRSASNG